MATQFFLRDSTRNSMLSPVTGNRYRDLSTTRGASSVTGIVNSTASGSDIVWTKTAGGAALEWISPRVVNGITVAGTVTVNIRALESSAANNCVARVRVYFVDRSLRESLLGGTPSDITTELGTADAANNWTFTPTSTSMPQLGRIVVRAYINNIGTMGAGTCTMTYDGPTSAAAGDSYITFTETFQLEAPAFVLRVPDLNKAKNTLPQSQDFDVTASWIASNVTVTAAAATAPDGTTTACQLDTTSNSIGNALQSSNSPFVSSSWEVPNSWESQTYSIYIQNNSGPGWIQITNSGNDGAYFDVINGVTGTVSDGSTSISNAGSGWWRCVWTFGSAPPSTSDGRTFRIRIVSGDGGTIATNVGDSVFVWGAQVESGNTATEYFRTTTGGTVRYIPSLGDGRATMSAAGRLRMRARPEQFSGAGSLSLMGNLRARAFATMGGIGSYSVDTTLITGGGAQIWSGEATFNGLGGLTASVFAVNDADATFSGASNFSVFIYNVLPALVALAGAGGLTVSTNMFQVASVELDGAGTLSVNNINRLAGLATFSGSGALSANVGQKMTAQPRFQGAGSLQLDIPAPNQVGALFQGAGGMNLSTMQYMTASARFSGTGSMSLLTAMVMPTAATFAGVGTQTVLLNSQLLGFATFNGSGGMSANSRNVLLPSATFQGAGALTVSVFARNFAAGTFAGAGNLSADTSTRLATAATFQGAGALNASVSLVGRIAVTYQGTGGFTAAIFNQLGGAATFAGAGGTSVFGNLIGQIAAVFNGGSDFSIDARVPGQVSVWDGQATFSGIGVMSLAMLQRMTAQLILAGAGGLLASVAQRSINSIRMAGDSVVSAYANLRMQALARFNGISLLSVNAVKLLPATLVFGEAIFNGSGRFLVDSVVTKGPAKFYDFPVGRSLDSDYGIRGSMHRDRLIAGRRRWR